MSREPFDPTKYLTRVNGAEYLEVKFRLVWLRDRYPDAEIETQLISLQVVEMPNAIVERALFKAVIRLPDGQGLATGYGSETANDFRDFIEKAESKAIGRALAHLGFGTPGALEGEAASGRVVDAPVLVARLVRSEGQGEPEGSAGPDQAATPRQLRYLQAVAREAGLDKAALDARAEQEFGMPHHQLTKRDASTLIDLLQRRAEPALT